MPNQNKVSTEKLSKLKKDLAKRKIVDDRVRGERCQDAKLLYKAFKKLGLFVLSDKLQFGMNCDTLVDVTDQANRQDGDEIHPVAFENSDYEYEDSFASVAGNNGVISVRFGGPPLNNAFLNSTSSFDEVGNNILTSPKNTGGQKM